MIDHVQRTDHVAIMGLGIIGSLTALAILQRTNTVSVAIYEVRDAPATIGGALNLSPNAVRAMDALGASPATYGGLTPRVLFQNEHGVRIGEFKYGGLGDPYAAPFEGMRVVRNDIQVSRHALFRKYIQD